MQKVYYSAIPNFPKQSYPSLDGFLKEVRRDVSKKEREEFKGYLNF
jgi:hypothetical protein